MKRIILIMAVCLGWTIAALAQPTRISYSEPERDEARKTDFDIVGKVGGNFMVYKNYRSTPAVCVYDNDMKLLNRTEMKYIDADKLLNIDFVAYPDHVYAIYQVQKKSVVYCYGVKLDATGNAAGNPMELDTSNVGSGKVDKIYTVLNNDNKQNIMLLKINSRDPRNYIFTTLLFDAGLQLADRNRMSLSMDDKNNYFSDFYLTNNKELVFCKFTRTSNNSESITAMSVVTKHPDSLDFSVQGVDLGKRILDEIRVKVDNANNRLVMSSFYYKQRRGNVEGLYTMAWSIKADSMLQGTSFLFNDDLREVAKGENDSKKTAFDNFYIKNIITRKDGGYILIAESVSSYSRGNNYYNRWNSPYWGGYMSPMDYYYYSPYSYYSPYYSPWNRWNQPQGTRYNADNVLVASFNADGKMEWNNIIPKSQYDDDTDNMISFGLMNTGDKIYFLYNQYEKRALVLSSQTIDGEGKVVRDPTIKNLDKGYEFMPRFARQVGAHQFLVPCLYRSYLCFAKIDF